MVLLLSLQFHAAIMFLAQDPSTRPHRVDAPHVAIALHLQGVLTAAGAFLQPFFLLHHVTIRGNKALTLRLLLESAVFECAPPIHLPTHVPRSDDGASERSSLVHMYGKQFVTVRPELALEYYMLAAALEVCC